MSLDLHARTTRHETGVSENHGLGYVAEEVAITRRCIRTKTSPDRTGKNLKAYEAIEGIDIIVMSSIPAPERGGICQVEVRLLYCKA
jgi:hypothetical protein